MHPKAVFLALHGCEVCILYGYHMTIISGRYRHARLLMASPHAWTRSSVINPDLYIPIDWDRAEKYLDQLTDSDLNWITGV